MGRVEDASMPEINSLQLTVELYSGPRVQAAIVRKCNRSIVGRTSASCSKRCPDCNLAGHPKNGVNLCIMWLLALD